MAWIARLVAFALLTGASIVAVGTQSASATPGWCHPALAEPFQVRTCIHLEDDLVRNLRAWGTIVENTDDGRNFDVDITMVKLQFFDKSLGVWRDRRVMVEQGWEPVNDRLHSPYSDCWPSGDTEFRAVGKFRWRLNDQIEYQEMATSPFLKDCGLG